MTKPPKILLWLLDRFCPPSRQDLKGDFLELYELRAEEWGRARANWRFLWDTLTVLPLHFFMKNNLPSQSSIAMFSHYVKIAFRGLSRSKVYSSINILGLAVGMGACLLIYQYISFELSYDRFHPNAGNTYRLTQTVEKNGEMRQSGVMAPLGLGAGARESIPEVRKVVRIRPQNVALTYINPENNERHQEDNMWYVDPGFLKMFDFPLKYGDKESALTEKYSMVLSEEMAFKYFGDTDPLEKTIRISGGTLSGDFVIKGVLERLPENTHLQFDVLISMQFVLENWRVYQQGEDWFYDDFVTYVVLDPMANLEDTGHKFDQLVTGNIGDALETYGEKVAIGFQPIEDVHLKSAYSWDIASGNGDIRNINYFMVIGAFILLMAWVNYINMSTARAMQRAKEVGIRKSIGAYKGQLISQFIVESAIINSLAGLLAIGITLLLLPLLSGLVGKEIAPTVLNSMDSWQVFMAVLAAGSVLSGLYPAFVLSSFGPVSAHKSGVVAANGSAKPRKVLITFQFFVSVLLITGTWLVYQQISFMKAQDLGMDIDEVLVVNGPRVALESHAMEIGTFHKVFKTEATNHHSISAVTAITNVPGMGYFASESMRRKGDLAGQEKVVNVIFADPDFVDVLDLKMVAGEPLKGSRAENPSYRLKSNIVVYKWLVLNEEAVRLFDLGTPQQAINKELVLFGDTSVVVGVIKNPNWSSLRDTYAPMVFPIDDESAVYFSVKMHTSDIQESISYVEQAFHAAFPNDPFEYFFLDDAFNRQYQTDQQFGNLFTAFSVLAIFISCLGLFALVSFSASLKAKEIGIRKVLGASVGQLMALLSKEYLVLLLIASLLAVPLAIWGGQQWLENYAFRIEMGVEFIVIPAFLLLIVSVLTVSHSTWKAASANPVDSLKAE